MLTKLFGYSRKKEKRKKKPSRLKKTYVPLSLPLWPRPPLPPPINISPSPLDLLSSPPPIFPILNEEGHTLPVPSTDFYGEFLTGQRYFHGRQAFFYAPPFRILRSFPTSPAAVYCRRLIAGIVLRGGLRVVYPRTQRSRRLILTLQTMVTTRVYHFLYGETRGIF